VLRRLLDWIRRFHANIEQSREDFRTLADRTP